MIVNGPIAQELDINAGHNAFGPGRQANATIGRAIRLALLNIGGAIPTVGDMATMGQPGKYSYRVAENEAANPWEPLHVERGFAKDTSTVTIVGAEGPHNINDHESITAQACYHHRRINGDCGRQRCLSRRRGAGGADRSRTREDDCGRRLRKADVKRFLFENANSPLRKFSKENIERRLRFWFKGKYDDAGPDTLVPMLQRPEDLIVVVIGGAGKHSAYIPTFGATLPLRRR